MRIILYANDILSIVFPKGKIYSIWTNGNASPGGIVCNGRVLWGELLPNMNYQSHPVLQLVENSEKIVAFAFGADTNNIYGHTLEDSIWLSVYDHKHRGHDLER